MLRTYFFVIHAILLLILNQISSIFSFSTIEPSRSLSFPFPITVFPPWFFSWYSRIGWLFYCDCLWGCCSWRRFLVICCILRLIFDSAINWTRIIIIGAHLHNLVLQLANKLIILHLLCLAFGDLTLQHADHCIKVIQIVWSEGIHEIDQFKSYICELYSRELLFPNKKIRSCNYIISKTRWEKEIMSSKMRICIIRSRKFYRISLTVE